MGEMIDLTDGSVPEVERTPVPGPPPVAGAQWDEVHARWEAWDERIERWYVVGGPREEREPADIDTVFVTHGPLTH